MVFRAILKITRKNHFCNGNIDRDILNIFKSTIQPFIRKLVWRNMVGGGGVHADLFTYPTISSITIYWIRELALFLLRTFDKITILLSIKIGNSLAGHFKFPIYNCITCCKYSQIISCNLYPSFSRKLNFTCSPFVDISVFSVQMGTPPSTRIEEKVQILLNANPVYIFTMAGSGEAMLKLAAGCSHFQVEFLAYPRGPIRCGKSGGLAW